MVFSSSVFLSFFLPVVLVAYFIPFIHSRKYKNCILLLSSLVFYAYGEPVYVVILFFSILVNWILGRSIETGKTKIALVIGIVINIGILFVFKYLDFTISNINSIFGVDIPKSGLPLPIGISFYTFQAISYLADIYRGKAHAQKSFWGVGVYIALFPQLVAGPIVRYDSIADELMNRKETLNDAYYGIRRFVCGLGKKVLIADQLSVLADRAFSLPSCDLSCAMAWLGALAYSLQIFFDFSGYSDMAIGLGRIFGFHFCENFNFPYISKTITEFWRRWHISLGTWFRDYVYIPLGGNRKGFGRQIINLLIVWAFTGLWHGANWTFVIWGGFQFIILLIEKVTKYPGKATGLGRIYVIPAIMIGWTVFRAENLEKAFDYIIAMFGSNGNLFDGMALVYFESFIVPIFIALFLCMPHTKIKNFFETKISGKAFLLLGDCVIGIVFILSYAYIIRSSYSPFIYFNF